ncbi:hypothetical protein WBJ53_11915 [Spirosoma sp. SC4-14]|uniref:hypothetical protein n=1 Tax=Spirosoma sp. SC4-14 TaxID=3128900 RepID=UPI0030CC463D
MSGHYATYLLEQLIRNKLSIEELGDFLAGLEDEDSAQTYSDILEAYFQELIKQQRQDPSSDDISEKPQPNASSDKG